MAFRNSNYTRHTGLVARLLGGYESRRMLLRLLLLLLALALSIAMLLSIGKTGRVNEEMRAVNALLRATDELQIQYGRAADAIATFMFLGSDDTWNEARGAVGDLASLADALLVLVRRDAPEQITAARAVADTVQQYQSALIPLKEIRQDSRGVVAGVRASNISQASHNYAFISRLVESITAVAMEATELHQYALLDRLRDVQVLWLRIIMEFRAHLMLRNEPSRTTMNVYIDAFVEKWQALISELEQLPLEVQTPLEEADIHQQRWLSALPRVLEVHGSKRWREDLRYVEDKLRPLSDALLSQLNGIVVTLSERQKRSHEHVLTNEHIGLIWAAVAMSIGTLLSITLLFILNRMLQQQERQRRDAEQASRMKTEFLSRMSHELRTPMNAILGFAQLLESDPDEPLTPKQHEQLREILNGGYHLLDLINEVLDLTAIESGKARLSIEDLPLFKILDDSLALVRPLAAQRGIQVVDGIGRETARFVRADGTRLKQVLINLMSNAIKYNRQGGTVWLTCGEQDNGLRIAITDTGPGIDPDDQEKLFQPFERLQTDDSVEGTGIGLVVAKQLVESMGGRIGVVSAPGEGSTFWVELLVVAPPTAPATLSASTPVPGDQVGWQPR